MENTEQENEKNIIGKKQMSVSAAIIFAGLLIAGAVYFSNVKQPSTVAIQQPNPQEQQQPLAQAVVDISKVKIDGEPFIGDLNAPVTIAYWSDYQCPFCKRFET